MSKDGISRTDAPREAALRTSAWVLGTLRAGTVGCALGKEPAGPGRQHRVTAAVTPPVTPSEMHCRYTPTLLGALKLSGTS